MFYHLFCTWSCLLGHYTLVGFDIIQGTRKQRAVHSHLLKGNYFVPVGYTNSLPVVAIIQTHLNILKDSCNIGVEDRSKVNVNANILAAYLWHICQNLFSVNGFSLDIWRESLLSKRPSGLYHRFHSTFHTIRTASGHDIENGRLVKLLWS